MKIDTLITIFSGGQIGVDRAALLAAEKFSFCEIDGWCPKGRKSEDGRIDEKYPLMETPSDEYRERTEWNVRDSDGTLILVLDSVAEGSGTERTINLAKSKKKPLKVILLKENIEKNIKEVIEWIVEWKVKSFNVAGPREDHSNGIQATSYKFMVDLLEKIGKEKNKIKESQENIQSQFQVEQKIQIPLK